MANSWWVRTSGWIKSLKNRFFTQYAATCNAISDPYKLIYIILLRLSMLWKSIHCLYSLIRIYRKRVWAPAMARHLSSMMCWWKIPCYWNKEELVLNSKTKMKKSFSNSIWKFPKHDRWLRYTFNGTLTFLWTFM